MSCDLGEGVGNTDDTAYTITSGMSGHGVTYNTNLLSLLMPMTFLQAFQGGPRAPNNTVEHEESGHGVGEWWRTR